MGSLQGPSSDPLEGRAQTIEMSAALCAASMLRFIAEQLPKLPPCITARLLDQYDVLMLLAPLIERKPWERREGGEMHRFVQNQWVRVGEGEKRRMAKCEAQCWLAVYALLAEPELRRKYQFNAFRKNVLMKLRGELNERVVDQIPLLSELQVLRSHNLSPRSHHPFPPKTQQAPRPPPLL